MVNFVVDICRESEYETAIPFFEMLVFYQGTTVQRNVCRWLDSLALYRASFISTPVPSFNVIL